MNEQPSALKAAATTDVLAPPLSTSTRVALIILAFTLIMLRIGLWRVNHNSDLLVSFIPWQTYLIEHGRWHALASPISNYFPAYFDLAILTSYLDGHVDRAVQVKLLSFCFDLAAAAFAFALVRHLLRSRPLTRARQVALIVAPFTILAGPTVIINGSMWGQTDIVYSCFLLLTVYAVILGSGAWAALFFGFALAFKLQAVFLIPFLGAMLLRRRIRWLHLLLIPVGWIVSILPAVLNGANVLTLLRQSSEQGTEFRTLNINLGNPWLLAELAKVNYRVGMMLGLTLTVVVTLLLILRGSRAAVDSGVNTLMFATVSLLTMPYIMPKMHERYVLPAEIFLSILSCVDAAFILPTALVLAGSLIGYCNYFLYHVRYLTLGASLAANSCALLLAYQLFRARIAPVQER